METDPFSLNILGVTDLIESPTNKQAMDTQLEEGIESDFQDELELDMSDAELIALKKEYENRFAPYAGKIEIRQKQNKTYLFGTQGNTGLSSKVVPSNLLFEATATFVPQALAKNPEPVVWSDNTDEGKEASNDIKTMLQFQAMSQGLRQKLAQMVWKWSVYLTAYIKYGWDSKTNEIRTEVRKPQNLVMDPDGYIDEFGEFCGDFVGERITVSARKLADMFPKHAEYIRVRAAGKMGTQLLYTEWWNDDYCFSTFEDVILDKHKNEFFNYDPERPNHFAVPKMPFTFLTVFSLQEQPHDFTNLIEQNIANQDRINSRDRQIEKNLAHGNNSIIVSDISFNSETAHQAADALEKGDPILAGGDIDKAIRRIPANPLPDGIIDSQNIDKETLRSIYGTQGLTAQEPNENTTARGMILNQSHDSTRIGGGVGDSLEIVATSFFNWMLQLMYVFYDEKHYAAVMGSASAVEYAGLTMVGHQRKYIVSVAPDSMQPKDELTQVNQTIQLWEAEAIDPIGLFKGINDSDPMNSAKRLVIWKTNPQLYLQTYFPEIQPAPNSPNPGNPPETPVPPNPGEPTLSAEPASSQLGQVPLPQ